MSILATTQELLQPVDTSRRRHRLRVTIGATLAILLFIGLLAYGLDYYSMDRASRPHSAKHRILRPSGTIGIKLGQLGTLMFLGLYLYPIRKRWPWLLRQGNSKHWLDVHILLGLTAPVVIAFHASFKFNGLAGVAFWIMTAVAASGIVGRYLFAQIPRSLSAAELSLSECRELQNRLGQQLASQKLFAPRQLENLAHFPTLDRVQHMALPVVLLTMVALDVRRQFRVAALRRRLLGIAGTLLTFGGLLASRNPDLERAIRLAREQAALSKRVLFLARTHQVFQLWHVVHRPFSYSFSVLAAIHIVVVLLFGVM